MEPVFFMYHVWVNSWPTGSTVPSAMLSPQKVADNTSRIVSSTGAALSSLFSSTFSTTFSTTSGSGTAANSSVGLTSAIVCT
jgi:hypothetical protein